MIEWECEPSDEAIDDNFESNYNYVLSIVSCLYTVCIERAQYYTRNL